MMILMIGFNLIFLYNICKLATIILSNQAQEYVKSIHLCGINPEVPDHQLVTVCGHSNSLPVPRFPNFLVANCPRLAKPDANPIIEINAKENIQFTRSEITKM